MESHVRVGAAMTVDDNISLSYKTRNHAENGARVQNVEIDRSVFFMIFEYFGNGFLMSDERSAFCRDMENFRAVFFDFRFKRHGFPIG
mgnify:CR=1 FL=1